MTRKQQEILGKVYRFCSTPGMISNYKNNVTYLILHSVKNITIIAEKVAYIHYYAIYQNLWLKYKYRPVMSLTKRLHVVTDSVLLISQLYCPSSAAETATMCNF